MTSDSNPDPDSNSNSDEQNDRDADANTRTSYGLHFDFERFAHQGDSATLSETDSAADRVDIPAPPGTGPVPGTKVRELDDGDTAITGPNSLGSWISSSKVVDLEDAR